jgi:murein DD-endopeptidase MepM/ murein hydrolase activator NlpD
MKKLLLFAVAIVLSACQPSAVTSTSSPETVVPTFTPIPQPSQTPSPIPTTMPATATITPLVFSVCSPLEDETFESLPLILVNPLDIPPFGQDVGHHGQDFAYFQRGDRESIEGIEIYAILSGKVVTMLEDHYPYGNTILIETPLTDLPPDLAEALLDAYLPVPEDPGYRLYCPPVTPPANSGAYSVYHLYAHLEEKSTFTPGESVTCGELLGTVGNTGYSSNPHLHLETRLGPSGATIEDMAHYENTATEDQMSTYCLWRMSGYYQLFDPFIFFNAAP